MKQLYTILLILLAGSVLWFGCDSDEDEQYIEQITVDGFLYIGQPMRIKLTHTVPIDIFYDADSVRVSGADVRITVEGHEFALIEQVPNDPGVYALPADSHLVQTGLQYDLRIVTEDTVITGSTIAAAALELDFVSLENYTFDNADQVEYGDTLNPLYVHWQDDPANLGYIMLIEVIDPDYDSDSCDFGGDTGAGTDARISGWTASAGEEDFVVPWVILGCPGLHRMRVFSAEQNWWDYFITTQLGTPENYPVTSLSGALGVFCAVGVDTVYFELVDEVPDE